VRHLILPEGLAGSEESLRWLAKRNLTGSQRQPDGAILSDAPCLALSGSFRGITEAEYLEVIDLLEELGIENGWIQEMSAPENYRPDFERESHPFI